MWLNKMTVVWIGKDKDNRIIAATVDIESRVEKCCQDIGEMVREGLIVERVENETIVIGAIRYAKEIN